MANIQPLGSTEPGASARTKVNAAIAEANKVDSKADASALALETAARVALANVVDQKADASLLAAEAQARVSALESTNTALASAVSEVAFARGEEAALIDRFNAQDFLIGALYPGAEERPGDARALFTSNLSGSSKTVPPVAFGAVATGANGAVLRVEGAATPLIVASRQDFAIEPGQTYAGRWAVSRFKNTSDPYGDAVEFRIAWLDANKNYIATVLVDKRALTIADGRFSAEATYSRDQEADYTTPASACYARPYVRILPNDGTTDIEVIRRWESNGLPGSQGSVGREPEYFLDVEREEIRWRQADGSLGPILDIGSARKKAEAAKDIAAGYASDMSTRSDTVPIYATTLGMTALSLPAGLNAFRTNGYAAAGDGGGWPLVVEVPNTGTLQPWQVQTNGGTRRWELRANEVNLEMFGGKADSTGSGAALGGTDNSPAINAAIAYRRHPNSAYIYGSGITIRFGLGRYSFYSPIKIKKAMRLIGASSAGMGNQWAGSQLCFPPDCDGIITYSGVTIDLDTGLAAGTYADGTIIENLELQGGGSGAGRDRNKHGIRMRARTVCRNLKISEFGGNAYDIRSNGTGEGDSNVNNWEIWGGRTSNCLNGIYTQGGDASAGNAYHVDNSSHLQAGILDRSFLGNYYFGCHENGCGKNAKVIHNGQKYDAAQTLTLFDDPSPLSTTEPGTNSAIWVPTSTTNSGYFTWVSGNFYCPGAQKASTNRNARTTFFGGYSENGWAPNWILHPAMHLGGLGANRNNGDSMTLDTGNFNQVRSLTSEIITTARGDLPSFEGSNVWNQLAGSRFAWTGLYAGVMADGVTKRGGARIGTLGTVSLTANTSLLFDYYNGTSNTFERALALNGNGFTATPGTDNVWSFGSSTLRWLKGWFGNISLFPAASVTPTVNGEMTFQLTSNTALAIRVRGSDGVVRTGTITLA